jgi:hypothetical protein
VVFGSSISAGCCSLTLSLRSLSRYRYYHRLRREQQEIELGHLVVMPKRVKRRSDIVPFTARLRQLFYKWLALCLVYIAYPFVPQDADDDDNDDEIYHKDRIWCHMNKFHVLQGDDIHFVGPSYSF